MGSGIRHWAGPASSDLTEVNGNNAFAPALYFHLYDDNDGSAMTGKKALLAMEVYGKTRSSGAVTTRTQALGASNGWFELGSTGWYFYASGNQNLALPGDYMVFTPDVSGVTGATGNPLVFPRSQRLAKDFPYEYGLFGLTFSTSTDSLTALDDVMTSAASAIVRDD